MNCVKSTVEIEDIIKKSRFIGILIPCQSENEALLQLNQQHQQHPNASHIVYAYRIKSVTKIITRFNDAGEPSGTAGKPIFLHLEGKDLINLICIVIRYYGGIKLGAGGLTRAYGNTAKKAIAASSISKFIKYTEFKLELEYKQMQNFEYHLTKLKGIILDQEFSENISLVIKIPEQNQNLLLNLFQSSSILKV
jgi:uncharacterized YigZ family protein